MGKNSKRSSGASDSESASSDAPEGSQVDGLEDVTDSAETPKATTAGEEGARDTESQVPQVNESDDPAASGAPDPAASTPQPSLPEPQSQPPAANSEATPPVSVDTVSGVLDGITAELTPECVFHPQLTYRAPAPRLGMYDTVHAASKAALRRRDLKAHAALHPVEMSLAHLRNCITEAEKRATGDELELVRELKEVI